MGLQPTSENLKTAPEFLKSAKRVIIDSSWSFTVSKRGSTR